MTGFFNPFADGAGGGADYNNLTNKPTINGVTVQGSLTAGDLLITAADVGALPSGTKYGADFALTIDSQTFIVTAQLKDQDGNNLGQAKIIDLPLETMVVGGRYDDTTQKVILTLKNGQTVEFSVADLVNGLQNEITLNNKLDADLVDDVSSRNKFVTSTEKSTWNDKQDTISDLATIRSGAAAGATALQQSNVSSTYSATGTAPVNGAAVNAAIETLDVGSVGGSGKYISAISETNGKISATPTTFDTVLSSSSTNENAPTSKTVYDDQQRQETEIGVVANAGAKNVLQGTFTPQTLSSVTFTVNSDGTVIADGTASASANLPSTTFLLKAGTYIFTSSENPQRDNTYDSYVYNTDANLTVARDNPNDLPGNTFTLSQDTNVRVNCRVAKNYTASNLTFKPMIRRAEITDDTFVPYAKTNVDLTNENANQQLEIDYTINAGAKNLLKITATSQTSRGVTFTVNDDQTVTVNGTNDGTGASTFVIVPNAQAITIPDGNYILSGCPASGEGTATAPYDLRWYSYSQGKSAYETGAGALVTKNGNTTDSNIAIVVKTGQTANNLIYKPMLRLASITDSTFQPYAKTNRELTVAEDEDRTALIGQVDGGAKNSFNINASPIVNHTTYTLTDEKLTVSANGIWAHYSVPIDLPAGDYILSMTISDYSKASEAPDTSMRLRMSETTSGGTNVVLSTITGNGNVLIPFTWTGGQIYLQFYPNYNATSYANSFSAEDVMICTAADYAISPAFVPYRPSYDNLVDEVSQLKNYIGYEKFWILGLQVDYQNKIFTRLGKAVDLTPGLDFNQFNIYNKRRRCNVSDDGTINAFYGESGYIEDGTNGQVMVYQPKFYYKVEPLKLEPIVDGEGYHIRKANYYISETPRDGFKLHPAFKDENGNELEYYLIGAYEASLYDVSELIYILDDAQVADFSADKICSIANAKPISGLTQNLTRNNCEKLATNRGTRWHNMTIQIASAEQLLFMIEYGKMNAQETIGKGVINKASGEGNESINTGSTSNLGNASGAASGTDGLVSIAYRGVENLWGNVWSWIDGVNIWGDGTKKGGIPYITNKLPFVENTKTDYNSAGFTTSGTNGYISAMGYGNPDYDWVFFASETTGNSTLPVGDYQYYTANLNGYRVARLGGAWDSGLVAGLFCWNMIASSSARARSVGGRGVIIPDINATNYWTNIRKVS